MQILKKIIDFIYGTKYVKRKFIASHANEEIIACDASKGIITKSNTNIKRSLNWVTSQRAVILLTNKRIKCGKWDILLDDIISAQLVKIRTTFGPGQVIKIITKDGSNFQFGMQANEAWSNQTVLPLTIEKGKLKFSVFSIIIRLIIVGYIIYWFVKK